MLVGNKKILTMKNKEKWAVGIKKFTTLAVNDYWVLVTVLS